MLSIGPDVFGAGCVEKNVQERCPAGVSIWSNHPTLLRLGSIVCQILLDRENTIGDLILLPVACGRATGGHGFLDRSCLQAQCAEQPASAVSQKHRPVTAGKLSASRPPLPLLLQRGRTADPKA